MSDDQTLAKISQNALVVSFKNAKSPTIWRAKLDTLDEMSFTVHTVGKGKYTLVATKDKDSETIAEFSTKTAGEQALNAITDVLFNLDGVYQDTVPLSAATISASPAPEQKKAKSFTGWRAFYWVTFVILFLCLFGVFSKGVQTLPLGGGDPTSTTQSLMPDAPTQDTMGGSIDDMPDPQLGRTLPAEDFFKDR